MFKKIPARLPASAKTLGLLGVSFAGFLAYRSLKAANFSFADKTILITGGSRGLGLELARLFAQEHARIFICARDSEELCKAEDELRAAGAQVTAIKCDVTNRTEVAEMMRQIASETGRLDVLINNAGRIFVGPFQTMSEKDFRELMEVHFWGAFYTICEALPLMQNASAPSIVNISSIGGKIAIPHLSAYSASKFALTGFTSTLRTELKKSGICVTLVCPGLMRTGSHVNAEFTGDTKAGYSIFRLADSTPVISIDARSAARKILSAIKHRKAEVVLGVAAKSAVQMQAVFPNLFAGVTSFIAQMLPANENKKRVSGANIQIPPLIRKVTSRIDSASQKNNEEKDISIAFF